MNTRLLRLTIVGSLLLIATIGWRDTMTVRLNAVGIPVPGLGRPVSILHTSDLHGARFGENQTGIAAALADTHFDVAVINGDHVPSFDADASPVLDLLSVLQEHADVVLVTRGNHDTQATIDALVAHGAIAIGPQNPPVQFASDAGTLVAIHAGENHEVASDTTLVLSIGHYPLSSSATAEQTAGRGRTTTLHLAGHTHGGQIRLPVVGALWAPGEVDLDGRQPTRTARQNFLPELSGRTIAGLSGGDGAYTHISRGLGTQALRLRLLAPAEMTVIALTPAP